MLAVNRYECLHSFIELLGRFGSGMFGTRRTNGVFFCYILFGFCFSLGSFYCGSMNIIGSCISDLFLSVYIGAFVLVLCILRSLLDQFELILGVVIDGFHHLIVGVSVSGHLDAYMFYGVIFCV